jgi:large subunit ribosomal protein L13e
MPYRQVQPPRQARPWFLPHWAEGYDSRIRRARLWLTRTAAGIPRKFARTIGISVDPRRQNLSEESLKANVARLQEYRQRLILFPRRNGKTKQGDASAEDIKAAKSGDNIVRSTILPIKNVATFEEGNIADYKSEENAYRKLRDARSEARLVGVRAKRAQDKADEAEAKKK